MVAHELFSLLDSAGDAAFAVDQNGRIRYWSRKAEELLGYSREEAFSKNCEEVLAGKDEADCDICTHDCQVIQMGRKRGEVPSYDLHAKTASGERKWLNVSIIVANLQRGPSPLIVHLMRDIDRQKQMESITRDIVVNVGRLTGKEADQLLKQGPSHGPPVDLTARELSILRLLSLGRNTKEIAAELHISVSTVRNHVQHILEKLQCHTRLEAVLRAARAGLV